jgi:ACS family hexuronate transporter-like MFS transporter
MAPERSAPPHAGWTGPVVMMAATLIAYIDRQALAVLSPMILKDIGLSAGTFGDALSAFSIAYMLANPLWGSVLDYLGLRLGMALAVLFWTLSSMSHAWLAGAVSLFIARTTLGVFEGGVFPGCMKMASDCLPAERRSRGVAVGYSGAALGSLVTPLLVTPLALRFGWRPVFWLTGALGTMWLVWWFFVARPPRVPHRARVETKLQLPNPLDRRFWLIVFTYGTGAIALGVVGYLSPLYLNRSLGLSQKELGYILWIPTVGWELGYFVWGWISDRFFREDPRPLKMLLLLSALALPVMFVTQFHSWPVVVAFLFWSMFIADGFIVMGLHIGVRVYPKDQSGMAGGIATGSWGAVLAIVLPVYGRLIDAREFGTIFVTMSLLPLAGTMIFAWLSLPWGGRPVRTGPHK